MRQRARRLRVPDPVAKLVRSLHPLPKRKLKASFRTLLSNPTSGKPLKQEPAGLGSFRVSRFRIVYRPTPAGDIEIVAVGPRDRIYEETLRIVRREQRSP